MEPAVTYIVETAHLDLFQYPTENAEGKEMLLFLVLCKPKGERWAFACKVGFRISFKSLSDYFMWKIIKKSFRQFINSHTRLHKQS